MILFNDSRTGFLDEWRLFLDFWTSEYLRNISKLAIFLGVSHFIQGSSMNASRKDLSFSLKKKLFLINFHEQIEWVFGLLNMKTRRNLLFENLTLSDPFICVSHFYYYHWIIACLEQLSILTQRTIQSSSIDASKNRWHTYFCSGDILRMTISRKRIWIDNV